MKSIEALEASGELFRITPLLGETVKRNVWVSSEINRKLFGPWLDEDEATLWRETLAKLEHIAAGNPISVGNSKHCQMAPMFDPPHWDVWDIRSKHRILGHFIEKDSYVGLVWDNRSNLTGPREWAHFINRCRVEWTRLFAPHVPLLEENAYDAYLSAIAVIERRY